MSDQTNPLPTQPVPPPLVRRESMKNTPAAKALAVGCTGCGGVILILICVAVVFAFAMKRAANTAEPIVDTFLAQLNEGRYKDAYAGTGDKYKSQINQDQFNVMCRVVKGALGSYQSKTPIGVFTKKDLVKGKTTSVTYTAHYQKGDATLFVLLQGSGSDLKIIGTQWNSELIDAAMKCPNCHAAQRQFGHFCVSCGKPIFAEDEQVPLAAEAPAEAAP